MRELLKKILFVFLKNKYAKKRYYSFFYFLYLQGLKGIDHGYQYIYPENSGELEVLKLVAKYYKAQGQKILFFDVGANTGYYAEKVLQIFKKEVELFCFEPSKYTFNKLVESLKKQIRPFHFAFSDTIGNATIYSDKAGSGTASLELTNYAPPFGIDSNLSEEIRTNTLDAFIEKEKIETVHFLKLDVEGHELRVLTGASISLKEQRFDFIQFEFGRINIDARVPLKMFYELLSNDYNIYRIIPDGLIPQLEYNYEYEIYLGTNFLAVKKSIDNNFEKNI